MSVTSLEHALEALGRLKEFAGMLPDGYIRPGIVPENRDNKIATYRSPSSLNADVKDYRENFGGSLKEHYQSLAKTAGTKPKNVARGGIITLAPTSRLASLPGDLGESVRQYGEPALARRALRRHEIVHSILQQRRKGPPDTVAKLVGEEFTAYRKQLFGKKSPARHVPLGTRVRKIIDGTIDSTKRGKKTLGITKWFEVSQTALSTARNRTDRNPTQAQIEAGNYRKGALSFHGLPVRIENPKGSTRRGVSDDGTPWESEMVADYGYFATSKAADGDAVDCFLGPDLKSHYVLAVDQYKGDEFDETKFILGTPNREEAERLYLKHYPKGWKLGPTSSTTTSQLKEWLQSGDTKKPFSGQKLKALAAVLKPHVRLKEFVGLIPEGYHLPATWEHDEPDLLASYTDPRFIRKATRKSARDQKRPLREVYDEAGGSDLGVSRMRRGGVISLPSKETQSDPKTHSGQDALHYGSRSVARRAYRRHEVAQSILQQRRGGPPDTVAKLAKEEAISYSKQLFGKKSPASHLPLGMRIGKFLRGVPLSTAIGKKSLGITKWFEKLTAQEKGMKEFEKPFLRYNSKRHARTGGLNDSFREKYNREHGSHLQRPVTKKPSELKPGSKSAKRRESFCARMNGVKGPTSKDGKLTPKGAALKRWNCSALLQKVKEFSSRPPYYDPSQWPGSPEKERHELLKTGILSAGLAGGLALAGRGLRGTVGAAEKASIQRSTANRIVAARRNARVAGEARAAESAKAAKAAAKDRYKAGNASFQNLARNPNLTKGEKKAVKRTHEIWKAANPDKEFSERSASEKLRDGAIGAGALAAGGGILHAGLKVGRAADEVSPTAKAIRAVLAHGEQAAGNLRKGWIGKILRLSDARRPKRFALKTEEDGVPLTGRTAHDRFVKTIRENDLDRRDRNLNNAASAGAVAGWLTHPKGAKLGQRLGRFGLGAAAGMGGVLAVRAITDKHRDIYGDRPRWAKRAESLPTIAGVGAAGAILAKKAKLFARGDYIRKVPGATPMTQFVHPAAYDSVIRRDVERYATDAGVSLGAAHRQVPVLRKVLSTHGKRLRPLYNAARKEAAAAALKKAGLTPKAPRRLTPALAVAGAGGALVGYAAGRNEKKEFSLPSENPRKQEIKAALSGAASGALLGGGTALLTRGKSLKSALQAAGIGAGAMGALAGGGTAIGNKVLGNPDPNDRAAFTKRAAVGGALAGAALGGLGAVALKKGALGAKASDAFTKGAKTWRPLHAIQNAGTPTAAAIGAGAGALYGAHQGADEGMMVDAINNSQIAARDQDKKNLSSKIRGLLKEFGYSNQPRERESQRFVSPTRAAYGLHGDVVDASGSPVSLTGVQTIRGFYNKGKAINRWGGRGTGLLRDTGDVLAGRGRRIDQAGRPQKREWEKAWFHRAVGSAAAGAALLGGAAVATKTGFGQKNIMPHLRKADAFTQKHGVSLFAAKLRRTLKQFDLDAALAGWDVRDPRGKSARVFAPGSRPRFRRPKEWHEKKENREALLKGAIVGTGLLGVAGGVAGTRKIAGLPVIPKLSKVVKRPYPAVRPGEKLGKFANFVPKEHRGGNIEEFPIKFRPLGAA